MRRTGWAGGPRLLALFLAAVTACSGPDDGAEAEAAPGAGPILLTDADGRTLTLPAPARRVVSLVPSATSVLHRIGAGGALVARTDFDTASWSASLPSVGGGLEPSVETIVAVEADLVIRFGGPQDPRTPARLDALGIPHLSIRPDGIEDVLASIRLLGRATGRDEAAGALERELRAALDSVRAAADSLPPVRAAYVLGGDPPWVAGPGTYIHELLEVAGGQNAFADLGRLYAAVSLEELVARQVDVIVTPSPGRLDPRFLGGARVAGVGDALELPGPGVAEAAWALLEALHPGATR